MARSPPASRNGVVSDEEYSPSRTGSGLGFVVCATCEVRVAVIERSEQTTCDLEGLGDQAVPDVENPDDVIEHFVAHLGDVACSTAGKLFFLVRYLQIDHPPRSAAICLMRGLYCSSTRASVHARMLKKRVLA